ncbi:hypothetical protein KSP39_PZI012838 [Platanthera zijinensis]|uniref:Transposase (putative) gypsy type domain-containing protein n=1 Tax=Platanthera zijinensis TaxID=2320716 RepID=A0AAP0BFT3_9ASPA
MLSARTDAAGDFRATDHKKCKLTDADLQVFVKKYMADSPVHVRLPLDQERINTSTGNQIVVLIDDFDCGFKFPLLWEIVEIFEHYGIVPGQLAPNTLAAIYSYVSYLRFENITFSLNIFRKIFFVRLITPLGGRPYKGVMYF